MKVYLCGHYHCSECRKHCVEVTLAPQPDGDQSYGFNAFWCENEQCGLYRHQFVTKAPLVEVDEVPMQAELVH